MYSVSSWVKCVKKPFFSFRQWSIPKEAKFGCHSHKIFTFPKNIYNCGVESRSCFLNPGTYRLLLYQAGFFLLEYLLQKLMEHLPSDITGLFLIVIRKHISNEDRVYYEAWTKLKWEESKLVCWEGILNRNLSSEPGSDRQHCPKPHNNKQAQIANKISFMEHSEFFKLMECSLWNRL